MEFVFNTLMHVLISEKRTHKLFQCAGNVLTLHLEWFDKWRLTSYAYREFLKFLVIEA